MTESSCLTTVLEGHVETPPVLSPVLLIVVDII